jgi:hypothetical protein
MKKDMTKFEESALKCVDCGNQCKPSKIKVEDTFVKGWKCGHCGYEIISPGDFEKAYLMILAKKREHVKISKRGNSYMITIPQSIAKALNISKSTFADIFLEKERKIGIEVSAS